MRAYVRPRPTAALRMRELCSNSVDLVVSRTSRIFPRMRMRVRKWAGEGKEYVWADLPGFCDSVVCAECLPRVHNDY